MGKVLPPLGLDKIVLKTESNLWSGRSSFLLKIHYQRESGIVFSLYLLFFITVSLKKKRRKIMTRKKKRKVMLRNLREKQYR